MYFAKKIREVPGYGKMDGTKVSPQDKKPAEQLVSTLSEDFGLAGYRDEYRDRLKALIDGRKKGQEIAAAPQRKRAPVIDIMCALKKSLASTGSSKERRHAKQGPARRASPGTPILPCAGPLAERGRSKHSFELPPRRPRGGDESKLR
jgi:non-homologous end joining protein Ku